MTLHFLCCLIPGVCLVWQSFVEMEAWGKGFSCCGAIEFLVLCHVPWCNEMSWWWAIECCKWIGFTPANPCVWRESQSTCISFCLLTQSSCGSCFYTQASYLSFCWLRVYFSSLARVITRDCAWMLNLISASSRLLTWHVYCAFQLCQSGRSCEGKLNVLLKNKIFQRKSFVKVLPCLTRYTAKLTSPQLCEGWKRCG